MSAWPTASDETRAWSGRHQEGEYSSSVPANIASQHPSTSTASAALAEDAAVAAARFDVAAEHAGLNITPALLALEARASSAIEDIHAEPLDIGLARLGRPGTSVEARLIVANELAISAALNPEATVIDVQKMLLHSTHPEYTGDYRTQVVWIGSGWSSSPLTAVFVPPHHDLVPAMMADVDEFSRRSDIQVIVHAALSHAQFEAVHPFPDGNGRTGRALAQQMLRRHQLTHHTIIPISVSLQSRKPYIRGLTDYRGGHIEPIIETFARAVLSGAQVARSFQDELATLVLEWEERSTGRAGSAATTLLPAVATNPVIDAATAARLLGITVQNAQSGIDRLVQEGVLAQVGEGRRNRVWVARDALTVHDAMMHHR